MHLSIIIPVLNEETALENNLEKLQWVRQLGHEIIVVDGGSHDNSVALSESLASRVVCSPPGRALQMNVGAKSATGDVFLFLHIDTLLPNDAIAVLEQAMPDGLSGWGRFDVQLSGRHVLFRIIERMMNWRSRLTSIATGDQAIFVSRDLFERLDGYAAIPLMEDIEISRRLKKYCKPIFFPQKVVTSSRRWEQGGICKTVWLMWQLRLAYWLGLDPARLAKRYR
jgi:rSAM/selenodomain-associated transferase 2